MNQHRVNVLYARGVIEVGKPFAVKSKRAIIPGHVILAKQWDCLVDQVEQARLFWAGPLRLEQIEDGSWRVANIPFDGQARKEFEEAVKLEDYHATQAERLDALIDEFSTKIYADMVALGPANTDEYYEAMDTAYNGALAEPNFKELASALISYNTARMAQANGSTPRIIKPVTDIQLLGMRVFNLKGHITRFSELGKLYGHNRKRTKKRRERDDNGVVKPHNAYAKYEQLSSAYDSIPVDTFMAVALDCSHSTISRARAACVGKGYIYKFDGGNWNVIQRPEDYTKLTDAELWAELSKQGQSGKPSPKLLDYMRQRELLP